MEASETVRRNEAIARFMECPLRDELEPLEYWWEGEWIEARDLEFHKYWNDLMLVVDQITIQAGFSYRVIRDDFGDGIFYKCDFTPEHYGSYIHGALGFGKSMIESVWMAVSEHCLSLEPSPGAGV